MQRLKELNSLINLARALGQEPAPDLLEESQRLEKMQDRIRANIAKDLTEIFSNNVIDESQVDAVIENIQQIEPVKYELDDGPLTDEQYRTIETLADIPVLENEETWAQRVIDEQGASEDVASKVASEISRQMAAEGTVVRPEAEMPGPTAALEQKLKYLENWVSRIAATGAGSGEVNFRWLDDVNRASINDNWVLEYDAATKKFQFTKDIGPIDSVYYNPDHVDNHTETGISCWSNKDKTLNIHHPGGVIQQVGQESYMLVKNYNGGTIANGTVVRFAGAVPSDGEARILAAPMLADGTYPNLYVIGMATQDIATSSEGFITTFGKVRDLDTTGTPVSESWQVGDILYVHPTTTGALTRVKPTTPNNILPVCAVLKVDAAEGEVFVRPTFEQRKNYAGFSSTQDQYVSSTNTGVAITYNTTDIARGFNIGSSNSSRIYAQYSGLYNFQHSIQFVSTNNSEKSIWIWFRKNNQDIANSATRISIRGSDYSVASWNYLVSMNAGDWFEIIWAADNTSVRVDAPAATAFCPAIPSVILTVTEPAL